MQRNFNIALVIAGALAFAVSFALLYAPREPGRSYSDERPAATASETEPPRATPVGNEDQPMPPGEAYDDDAAESLAFRDAWIAAMEAEDAQYPEPADELLIVDRGDPTRYARIDEQTEANQRLERAKTASLDAASFVGDDRVQAIGYLGRYAGDGNAQAIAELQRILQSPDADLRADALDALAEVLPDRDVVPPFAEEPPTDEEVQLIIEALRAD